MLQILGGMNSCADNNRRDLCLIDCRSIIAPAAGKVSHLTGVVRNGSDDTTIVRLQSL